MTNKLHAGMPAIIAKAKADAEADGGGGAGDAAGDAVGALISAAAVYVVQYMGKWVVDEISASIKDKIFDPQSAALAVASNDFRWGDDQAVP